MTLAELKAREEQTKEARTSQIILALLQRLDGAAMFMDGIVPILNERGVKDTGKIPEVAAALRADLPGDAGEKE